MVTTEIVGESFKNDPSLSSASATRNLLCPNLAWPPIFLSFPPTIIVGSRCPPANTVATKDVVVVFPWVPAIAIPCFIRISSANISALGMTGIIFSLAALTSGLLLRIALETTTTCFPYTFSAV